MLQLTLAAKELVRAGRAALRPSGADRERVFHALLPKLGGGSAGGVNAALRAWMATRRLS